MGSKLFSAFCSSPWIACGFLSVRYAFAHAGAEYSIVGHLNERTRLLQQRWFTYLEISSVFETID